MEGYKGIKEAEDSQEEADDEDLDEIEDWGWGTEKLKDCNKCKSINSTSEE